MMANHLALATVSAALRLRLRAAISADITGVDVVTRRPDATDGQAASTVTVFLYRVTPNAALRNSDLPTRGSDPAELHRRPRVAVNLHYLLSFSGDEEDAVPQRMLGRSLASIHAAPTLTPAELQAAIQGAPWLAGSDIHEEVETVKLTLADLSLDDLTKLWTVFFQLPYRLSAAYEASVVLIESTVATTEALPVQERGVHAMPAPQPVVEHVTALGGGPLAGAPLDLELRGRNLRGPTTAVRFDGGDPQPVAEPASHRLVVGAGTLRAGPHVLQVVHELPIGDPPVPHSAVESATAGFVLRPSVTAELAPGPTPDPADLAVVVTFAPPLGAGQRVHVLLNEHPAPADRPARSFRLDPMSAPADGDATLRFRRGSVPAGSYVVRARVDGAESPVAFPAAGSGGVPAPGVTIP